MERLQSMPGNEKVGLGLPDGRARVNDLPKSLPEVDVDSACRSALGAMAASFGRHSFLPSVPARENNRERKDFC